MHSCPEAHRWEILGAKKDALAEAYCRACGNPRLAVLFISAILFLMIPVRTERKFCVARAAKEENVRMAGLKEHIFLIGFMGCGKSTNAARLAEMTGAEQVEMDQEIVNGEQMEIAEIFKEKGEPYFRSLETALIRSFQTGIRR